MKTLFTVLVENEVGNPSDEDLIIYFKQVLDRGTVGFFDLYDKVPISGLSLKIEKVERVNEN